MRICLTDRAMPGVSILAVIIISIWAACTLVIAQATSPTRTRADSSPARHRVLFNRAQVPVMTLFIAGADGRNEQWLTPTHGVEYSPTYSADGQWIVYTGEQAGQAEIYRIHPDGSGRQQLTDDPAFDDQGALSPDGKTLAFVSTRAGGTANIWLMDLSSKAYTNLTRQHSGNFRPSWSPDGKWIAFSSDRDAHPGVQPGRWPQLQSTGIYLIKPDGKGLRRLTRKDGVAGGSSWSPDGQRVLFYETDELGALLAKGAKLEQRSCRLTLRPVIVVCTLIRTRPSCRHTGCRMTESASSIAPAARREV